MRIIRARNVNEAFYEGMHLLDEDGVREDSRAGPVLVAPWPVLTVYENPQERVLFDDKRDANPFFHLMEGLWMLAGRYDAEFLNRYVADFGKRFAESSTGRASHEHDGTIHDAYGQRWRSALGFDQLNEIVKRLRSNPSDRQCVLQMWDGTDKPEAFAGFRGYNDLRGEWKTRPCNTHAYFRVRDVAYRDPPVTDENSAEHEARIARDGGKVLDMTICCRSNDAIWGAHGANAVHFSMLQEYLAGRIGIRVGLLFQLSNNYHGYADAIAKIGDPTQLDGHDPYENAEVHPLAMAGDWEEWDKDLKHFMAWHDDDVTDACPNFVNTWFSNVAVPVARARHSWTHGFKPSARKIADAITAPDWRRACLDWMGRRSK